MSDLTRNGMKCCQNCKDHSIKIDNFLTTGEIKSIKLMTFQLTQLIFWRESRLDSGFRLTVSQFSTMKLVLFFFFIRCSYNR